EIRSSTTTAFCPASKKPSTWFPKPCSFGFGRAYTKGSFNWSAAMAPHAMPAVATPANNSASGNCSNITLHNSLFMKSRMYGYDKIFLLSQYMGLFHPLAHVNGSDGFN